MKSWKKSKPKRRWSVLTVVVGVGLLALAATYRQAKLGLNGAWRTTGANGATVLIAVADNYLMETTYEPNRFISTRGGVLSQTGDQLNLNIEFDSQDSGRVGQTEPYRIQFANNRLVMTSSGGNRTFSRAEEPSGPTPLTGLWRITGRANEAGQLTTMQRGPRKTLKLLTGTRFQWAAINPQTKQFSGTGGGTYALKDGQYTETIDFFSRDNSRVGKSITFGATITGNDWRHTGQSSTGGKVDEVWSRER